MCKACQELFAKNKREALKKAEEKSIANFIKAIEYLSV
jgi:hypothetical protein